MRDPRTGKISLERDVDRDCCDYVIPNYVNVELTFIGDNKSTTLLVNNKEVSKLEKKEMHFSQNGKTKMFYMPTLVFPLEKCGEFNGTITNLRVEQL